MEAAQVSITRWWIKQLQTTTGQLHNGILLSCKKKKKKKKILHFVTVWIDRENIILSEISQSEKTNTILFHPYVESMNKLNQQAKQRQTHRWRAG